jgi:hypothetical protein
MHDTESFLFSMTRVRSVSEDAVEFMLSECVTALINEDLGRIGEAIRILMYEYNVREEDIDALTGSCLDSISNYGIHLEAIRRRLSVKDVHCLVKNSYVRLTVQWR